MSDTNVAPARPKQSSVVTIFSIWNTMVGTSLLAMPWGIERAGLLMGIILSAGMGAICLYTAYCNLETQKQHGVVNGDLFQLCRLLLGKWAEVVAKLFSYIVLFGATIVYWILMSNFLNFTVAYLYDVSTGVAEHPSILNGTVLCPSQLNTTPIEYAAMIGATDSPLSGVTFAHELPSLNLSEMLGGLYPYPDPGQVNKNEKQYTEEHVFFDIWNLKTVPIYLAVIIMPLLFFKSPTFFTKFNSLGTLSVLYLMLYIVMKSVAWGFPNIDYIDTSSIYYIPVFNSSLGAMSGMLSLSYFIHNIIITLINNNRNQENNTRDLSIAYILVIMTYIFVGCIGFIAFPLQKSCIQDNLLNNLLVSDPLTVFTRLFLFFQLVTVYPLIAFILRSQILIEITDSPGYKHIGIFNVVMVLSGILFAIFIPHIGYVIRYTGAISGFVHVFSLPCLLRITSLRKRGELTWLWLLVNTVIPVLGGINIFLQFIV